MHYYYLLATYTGHRRNSNVNVDLHQDGTKAGTCVATTVRHILWVVCEQN